MLYGTDADLTTHDFYRQADQILRLSTDLDFLLFRSNVFPRQRPYPVMYYFIRQSFPFMFLPERTSLPSTLNISLWYHHNFGEENFGQTLSSRLGRRDSSAVGPINLWIAEAESSNPCMWAIVCHELGHILEEYYRIEYRLVDLLVDGHTKLSTRAENELKNLRVKGWLKEFIADEIARRSIGPAYVCAFSSMIALKDYLLIEGARHPASIFRFQRLMSATKNTTLKLRGKKTRDRLVALLDTFERIMEERVSLDVYRKRTIATQPTRYLSWDIVWAAMDRCIDDAIPDLPDVTFDHQSVVHGLYPLLLKGVPAGGVLAPKIERRALELTNRVSNQREDGNRDGLADWKIFLKEVASRPVDPAELLLSGWLLKDDRIKSLEAELLSSTMDRSVEGNIQEAGTRLDKMADRTLYDDTLVRKSMEAAATLGVLARAK